MARNVLKRNVKSLSTNEIRFLSSQHRNRKTNEESKRCRTLRDLVFGTSEMGGLGGNESARERYAKRKRQRGTWGSDSVLRR